MRPEMRAWSGVRVDRTFLGSLLEPTPMTAGIYRNVVEVGNSVLVRPSVFVCVHIRLCIFVYVCICVYKVFLTRTNSRAYVHI